MYHKIMNVLILNLFLGETIMKMLKIFMITMLLLVAGKGALIANHDYEYEDKNSYNIMNDILQIIKARKNNDKNTELSSQRSLETALKDSKGKNLVTGSVITDLMQFFNGRKCLYRVDFDFRYCSIKGKDSDEVNTAFNILFDSMGPGQIVALLQTSAKPKVEMFPKIIGEGDTGYTLVKIYLDNLKNVTTQDVSTQDNVRKIFSGIGEVIDSNIQEMHSSDITAKQKKECVTGILSWAKNINDCFAEQNVRVYLSDENVVTNLVDVFSNIFRNINVHQPCYGNLIKLQQDSFKSLKNIDSPVKINTDFLKSLAKANDITINEQDEVNVDQLKDLLSACQSLMVTEDQLNSMKQIVDGFYTNLNRLEGQNFDVLKAEMLQNKAVLNFAEQRNYILNQICDKLQQSPGDVFGKDFYTLVGEIAQNSSHGAPVFHDVDALKNAIRFSASSGLPDGDSIGAILDQGTKFFGAKVDPKILEDLKDLSNDQQALQKLQNSDLQYEVKYHEEQALEKKIKQLKDGLALKKQQEFVVEEQSRISGETYLYVLHSWGFKNAIVNLLNNNDKRTLTNLVNNLLSDISSTETAIDKAASEYYIPDATINSIMEGPMEMLYFGMDLQESQKSSEDERELIETEEENNLVKSEINAYLDYKSKPEDSTMTERDFEIQDYVEFITADDYEEQVLQDIKGKVTDLAEQERVLLFPLLEMVHESNLHQVTLTPEHKRKLVKKIKAIIEEYHHGQ